MEENKNILDQAKERNPRKRSETLKTIKVGGKMRSLPGVLTTLVWFDLVA